MLSASYTCLSATRWVIHPELPSNQTEMFMIAVRGMPNVTPDFDRKTTVPPPGYAEANP